MSIKKTPSIKWLIPVILLSITSLVVWQGVKQLEPNSVESSSATELPPRAVTTTQLNQGEAIRTIKLIGQVEANAQATIRSRVDGLVKEVLVEVGDRLEPNQVVAILDRNDQQLAVLAATAQLNEEKSELAKLEVGTRVEIIDQRQAELSGAKARETEAQDNLQRISTLTQQGALSERDLVQAKTDADAARNERLRIEATLTEAQSGPTLEEIATQRAIVQAAEVALLQAQLNLERTVIRTDSAGVVQSKLVSPGDYLENSDPLMTLIDPDQIDIYLEVPESLIGQVKVGQILELRTRSLSDWKQLGEIQAIVPGTEAASRRQVVRVSLTEPSSSLLPGMAVQGTLELPVDNAENAFIVPRDALTRRNNQWLLFVINDNRVTEYAVEILADMGETLAITNPELQVGQTIVNTGGDGLTQGSAVKIISTLTP
ncbi:efflux RND transporter periplasmic adaptor subunit [Gloeocapsa sp. PCC 73106]|uniref:efflux RND transporter periplasmic adaptor subunit n=1 Tax=Gloeocapsa sp. PCC 73106 TaxID=102232 RepID=UPI0002AD0008|nr:efflux RND transporter periplasmic adaptor subunit [Gloeocapsa sp. PCC 73106]ELR98846.1 RND family efflux transporter, MFP subunit [Gloeocapsa sp. PCC 73106]